MTLRPAGPDDVPAVAALETEIFGVEAWSAEAVEAELCGPHRVALVAARNDAVLGYVVVMVAAGVADVNRIAVMESERRGGLASRLLDVGLEQARTVGSTRVLLEVADTNRAAIAFYSRAGFREIARRKSYYRDGSAALVMERHLGT